MKRIGYRGEEGFGLIEVLVGAAIVATVLIGSVTAFQSLVRNGLRAPEELKALYLVQGGAEGVRFLRDSGWNAKIEALQLNTPYYLSSVLGAWEATTTPSLIDGTFKRTATFESVYRRDSDKDIVASTSAEQKTLDPDARFVTVTVTATSTGSSVSITTLFTNLFEN